MRSSFWRQEASNAAPDVAWRALTAARSDDDADKRRLMRRSAVLRDLSSSAALQRHDEVERYAVDLLQRASREARLAITFGPNGDALVAGINVISILTRLSPAVARERADDTAFSRMVTLMILKQARIGTARRFPNDLMHLERALTLLETSPRESLGVFESLAPHFWQRFARVAVRDRTDDGSFVNFSGIRQRVIEQLLAVQVQWPEAAQRICSTDADLCLRLLHRFAQVAEWIDAEAIEWLADDDDQRGEWVHYQPLTLTRAAAALRRLDAIAAERAMQRSLELLSKVSTPAREIALAANAVVWQELDSPAATTAVTETLSRIRRLRDRGVSRAWSPWIPQFLEWTARIDPQTALVLAPETDMSIRASALARVAAAVAPR
jgi:hypothetical protein